MVVAMGLMTALDRHSLGCYQDFGSQLPRAAISWRLFDWAGSRDYTLLEEGSHGTMHVLAGLEAVTPAPARVLQSPDG
tara:strand:+ start:11075 stop:11308 length:234 start_codon:yes stop_codon:yes gene_type:complete